MRHRKAGRKLGRTSSHRKAMLGNMVNSLFMSEDERITTTREKAREASRLAEKMITLAKDGSISSRRRAVAFLHDKESVKRLFDEIAPRFESRNGGYTRILRRAKNRQNDDASQVCFELVEELEAADEGEAKPRLSFRRRRKQQKTDEAAETPAEEEAAEEEEEDEAQQEGENEEVEEKGEE